MKYISTRGQAEPVTADIAIRSGIAPDGGLYMPENLPHFDISDFRMAHDIKAVSKILLPQFFANSPLETHIEDVCASAFNFTLPVITPNPDQPTLKVLELFHGPTGAFKDFGARFLFRCLDHIADDDNPVTVLAATSGDTGGAVGCAAEEGRHARAVILFPKGRISAFQEHQLCCWDAPVEALRVDGDFDDCQALVKAAFANQSLVDKHGLTSANSISIGRLLPQMSYWAKAALDQYSQSGIEPGLIIPTGNLGNAVAALLARACGLPIGPIILATNTNKTLQDWHASGQYQARPALATIANAMDVGAPSNFERLDYLAQAPVHDVVCVDDSAIKARIRKEYQTYGYIACPHTATALEAFDRLENTEKQERSWLVGATAHPGKFADIVEPLIDDQITLPDSLSEVLKRPVSVRDIEASNEALAYALSVKFEGQNGPGKGFGMTV